MATETTKAKMVYLTVEGKTTSRIYGNILPAATDTNVAAVMTQIGNLQSNTVQEIIRVDSKTITV